MIRFEHLPTFQAKTAKLRSDAMPEVVHLEDPAFAVMLDYHHIAARVILANTSIDEAFNIMKARDVHMLIITDDKSTVAGIVGSEDILGEKPIQILQERRIERSKISVQMLMTPLSQITSFDMDVITTARVGNVVVTMQAEKSHYAFVVKNHEDDAVLIQGLFSTKQISKQLHQDIDTLSIAGSVSELQKRKTD